MSSHYQLSGVKLVKPDNDLWIVQPATPGWFLPVVGGGVFTLLGIPFLLGGGALLIAGLLFFACAGYFMITYPLSAQARFDFSMSEVIFTASYLLRRPRQVEWNVPFRQISSLRLRARSFGKSPVAQLQLQDGAELVMDFGQRVAEAEQLVQRFSPTSAIVPPIASNVALANVAAAQTQVQREIRSWGTWLLIIGVAQMFMAKGLSPWGIVLIIVGAASFYFREAPMLVVYAVTVGWAGLQNLLLGETVFWKGFAVLQAWIVFLLLRQVWQFRRAEKLTTQVTPASPADNAPAPAPSRTEHWFPLIALLLGGGSSLLFIAAFGSAFLLHNRDLQPLISLLETLAVNMAVLGLATGLAGWWNIVSNKWGSIVGSLAGGSTLVAELALIFFNTLP